MKTNLIIALSLGIVLASCGSIKPEPPSNMNQTIAVKELPVVTSNLDIPIEVNMVPFINLADSKVDKSFKGSDKPCEGLRYEYKLERAPFRYQGLGVGKIGLGLDLKYAAKGEYCASCMGGSCIVPAPGFEMGFSEPMKRVKVEIQSNLKLKNDYKIQSQTEIKEIKPIDPIKVIFGYDITDLLLKQAQPFIKDAMKSVDQEIGKLDLKPYIKPAFDELQKEIFIDQVGYLSLQPKELAVSDLNFDKNTLKFNVGIKATPAIKSTSWGSTVKPLPNLSTYKPSGGFEVVTDLKMDFDSLSKQVMSMVKGQKFEAGKNYIFVDNLKLFAAQDRLGVEVKFSGSKKGILFLTGKPVFDSEKNTVHIEDLQFDLSTKNILLKSAKWLLNETIRKKMQDAMNMDLSPQINDAKKAMNTSLNQEMGNGISLKGNLNTLKVTDIQILQKELFVRTQLKGKMSVIMK